MALVALNVTPMAHGSDTNRLYGMPEPMKLHNNNEVKEGLRCGRDLL